MKAEEFYDSTDDLHYGEFDSEEQRQVGIAWMNAFAAQQLEEAANACLEKDSIDDHWQRFGVDVADWLRARAAELRKEQDNG